MLKEPEVVDEMRLDVLDGIRGLAIVLVMLYHNFGFQIGWIGVDLFFVLSGFLITGTLVKSIHSSGYFKIFFIKRIFRIIPVYYSFLIIFFLLVPYCFSQYLTQSYSELWKIQASFWLFFSNCEFAVKGWPLNHTIVHFWSLACEVQFYFVWPIIIYCFYSRPRLLIGIMLVFILIAVLFRCYGEFLFSGKTLFRYVLMPSRLDAFSIGSIIFLLKEKWLNIRSKILNYALLIMPLLLLTMFVASTYYLNIQWSFDEKFVNTIGLTLNSIFWGSTIMLALTGNSFMKKIFKNKIAISLGRYSYAMYVFHLPVWVFISRYSDSGGGNTVWLALAASCITFLIGWFSYVFFERRFIGFGKKILDGLKENKIETAK